VASEVLTAKEMYKIMRFNYFFAMQFGNIHQNPKGNSPEGSIFLHVCDGCVFVFSLK